MDIGKTYLVNYLDDRNFPRTKKLAYKGRDGPLLIFWNSEKSKEENIGDKQIIRTEEVKDD